MSKVRFAVTGHHDGRMLSVAVRGDDGDLRGGLYGWTWGGCGYIDLLWGYPHGHDDIHLMKQLC